MAPNIDDSICQLVLDDVLRYYGGYRNSGIFIEDGSISSVIVVGPIFAVSFTEVVLLGCPNSKEQLCVLLWIIDI